MIIVQTQGQMIFIKLWIKFKLLPTVVTQPHLKELAAFAIIA